VSTETKAEEPRRGRGFELIRHPIVIVVAVVVGVSIGRLSEATGLALRPFGRLYLNLLVMCIIPLLFTALVSSLGEIVATHKLGRRLLAIAVVFVVGLSLAAAIGTGVGWVTGIGSDLRESEALGNLLLATESTSRSGGVAGGPSGEAGGESSAGYAELFTGSGGAEVGDAGEGGGADPTQRGFLGYLTQLIPRNLAHAAHAENYLGVLFFSILMGIALGYAPAEGRSSVLRMLGTFFDALLRIINWIIYLLPLGLVCIVAGEVARGGLDFVPVLGKLILVCAATTLIAMLLFTLTIWMVTRVGLGAVVRGLRGPLVVAFATASSMASIPAAIIALRREFGLAEENVKLLLPLGVMINPMGSALFFSLSAIFAVQLHSRAPGLGELDVLLMIVVGSVLAGVAAMGMPATGALNMLALILGPLGVPPEVGIIALLAVTPIVDPLFTMVNVTGNCAATCILDRRLRLPEEPRG
jgi:proton glutamate symport protein